MAVSAYHVAEATSIVNVWFQPVSMHTNIEQDLQSNIKFRAIHVVDEIDQYLLSATLSKVMDEKQDFFQMASILQIHILLDVIQAHPYAL